MILSLRIYSLKYGRKYNFMSLAVPIPETLNIIKADVYICLNLVIMKHLKREASLEQHLLQSFRLMIAFWTVIQPRSLHNAKEEGQVMEGQISAQVWKWTSWLNGCQPQTAEDVFDLKLNQIKAKIQTRKTKAALKIFSRKPNRVLKIHVLFWIQWPSCPGWIWEKIGRGRFTSTDLVPHLWRFLLERKPFKYFCLKWQKWLTCGYMFQGWKFSMIIS